MYSFGGISNNVQECPDEYRKKCPDDRKYERTAQAINSMKSIRVESSKFVEMTQEN